MRNILLYQLKLPLHHLPPSCWVREFYFIYIYINKYYVIMLTLFFIYVSLYIYIYIYIIMIFFLYLHPNSSNTSPLSVCYCQEWPGYPRRSHCTVFALHNYISIYVNHISPLLMYFVTMFISMCKLIYIYIYIYIYMYVYTHTHTSAPLTKASSSHTHPSHHDGIEARVQHGGEVQGTLHVVAEV